MSTKDLIKQIDEIKDKLVALQIKNEELPDKDLGEAIVGLKKVIDNIIDNY